MKKRYVTIPRNPDDSVVLAGGVDFRSWSQRVNFRSWSQQTITMMLDTEAGKAGADIARAALKVLK